ncbi:hypothetical protein DIS24_g10298 [Lasiodiplodia hormozganensis]|uniref:Uncharacterized protein n=1 Tax=Lasiodiplodia hormozganensis TaxID=869390 RepID=A0AA40CHP7_9PEZI|nr:hypothetical protein DIS24_g10298 [Lasiodiplodia hormozganensis]
MAQSSSTATNGTLTTSFYFPGGANAMMSPVASVIGVNDTFTDIVTYLIKCPSSSLSASDSASASASSSSATTPASTTTAPLNRRTVISATSTSTYTDTGTYSASDIKRTFCIIPEDGETLIVGPSTMNLLYTSSSTTNDISCAITWASSGSAASASATAAASASATPTTSAEAFCRMYVVDPGLNFQAIQDYNYPDAGEASMWPKLLVTAGLEKLQAASASATASMDSPTITGSGAEASSTGAAAALRFDFPTAMGMTGAAGILAVALAL